jgi:hypothetical protein
MCCVFDIKKNYKIELWTFFKFRSNKVTSTKRSASREVISRSARKETCRLLNNWKLYSAAPIKGFATGSRTPPTHIIKLPSHQRHCILGGLSSSRFLDKMPYEFLIFPLRVKRERLRKIFASRCQKEFLTWAHLKYRGRRLIRRRRNSTIVSLTWSCKAAGRYEQCFIHKNELTKHTCYKLCWAQRNE